jgi:hypothetical protein
VTQKELPVANTPDQHLFDDWIGEPVADLAEPLSTYDDRCRFYESVIRVGVVLMYKSHGYGRVREFIDRVSAGIDARWSEDCARETAPARSE